MWRAGGTERGTGLGARGKVQDSEEAGRGSTADASPAGAAFHSAAMQTSEAVMGMHGSKKHQAATTVTQQGCSPPFRTRPVIAAPLALVTARLPPASPSSPRRCHPERGWGAQKPPGALRRSRTLHEVEGRPAPAAPRPWRAESVLGGAASLRSVQTDASTSGGGCSNSPEPSGLASPDCGSTAALESRIAGGDGRSLATAESRPE